MTKPVRAMSLFSPFFEVERIERRSNEILWLWEQDQTKPITLYLSSQGGDAVVAAAFRNTIKLNKVDLHVVVVGEAHSAALIILSAGTKRVAWKGARFFFHDLGVVVAGGRKKKEEFDLHNKMLDSIEAEDSAILAATMGCPVEEIVKLKKDERILNASEAKEYGLIHEWVDIPE